MKRRRREPDSDSDEDDYDEDGEEGNAAKRDNGFRHMRATRPAFPRWGPTLEGRRDHLGTPIPPEAVGHLEPPPARDLSGRVGG